MFIHVIHDCLSNLKNAKMYEMQRCIKPESSVELFDFNHCLHFTKNLICYEHLYRKISHPKNTLLNYNSFHRIAEIIKVL